MKPIRHSFPFPHMRWPKAEEGVLSTGVCLGCEDALQEGLWRHLLDRQQNLAPLALITGPT